MLETQNQFWDHLKNHIFISAPPNEKMLLRREVISQEEVFDAINNIYYGHGAHPHPLWWQVFLYHARIGLRRTCHFCIEANPVIAPRHGAKKLIYSDNWHDCFQVDLVDFRKMPWPNIYGQVQHWLMAVKDHSTGFTALFGVVHMKVGQNITMLTSS